jgi:polysaccharide deacetylase family protein (PEP-CTERM system associated)
MPDAMTTKDDRVRNVLTVDVEDYFHVRNFADTINLEDWETLEEVAPNATYRILRLFEEQQVKATFFVLGWLAKRHPRLVRAIHAAGHEVACHGYFHEPVRAMTPDEFRADVSAAKKVLEDTIGAPVLGFRAPSFSIDESSLWAFDVLLGEGFEYDSSLFPGRMVPFGFAGVSRQPCRLDRGAAGAIMELPLTTLTVAGVKLPFAGGGFFRAYPYAMIRAGMRHINEREHAPVVVYFHPWELVPQQPRVAAHVKARIKHYLGLTTMEKKITRLLRDFAFVPASEMLETCR